MTATTATAATTKRAGKTPEQRKLDAETLHAQLLDQVEALTDSDRWRAFLDFSGSFYRFSLNNVLLILAQHPTAATSASAVAGFRAWQAKGRQVRKGEHGIKILGYSTKKTTEQDPATGEETTRVSVRYPILSVFALDQTDPIDGTVDTSTVTAVLSGDDPAGIYTRIHDHLTGLGWSITREAIRGAANGYTTIDGTRRIVIDADLSPAHAAKTLLHEAAHVTLHVDPPVDYAGHRGLAECEAESVAYVLARLAGLDTSSYSVGYIATWTHGNTDLIRSTASNVLGAVGHLAPALTDNPDHTTDDGGQG